MPRPRLPLRLPPVPAALALLVVLAGCGSNPAAPSAPAGAGAAGLAAPLEAGGTVTISPIHPVATPGEAQEAPLAGAVIVVEDARAGVVAEGVSDAGGRYRVTLPAAGAYRFVPQPYGDGPYPVAPPPLEVVVAAARTDVDFDYDSGIR